MKKIFVYLPVDEEYAEAKSALVAATQQLDADMTHFFEEKGDDRAALKQILTTANPGDVLVVAKFIVLARVPEEEWRNLCKTAETGMNVVALNLNSSLQGLHISNESERIASRASTATLLELAGKIIKYVQTNPLFAQKKNPTGSLAGRPVNKDLHHRISLRLLAGESYSKIQKAENCGRSTISRVKNSMTDVKEE